MRAYTDIIPRNSLLYENAKNPWVFRTRKSPIYNPAGISINNNDCWLIRLFNRRPRQDCGFAPPQRKPVVLLMTARGVKLLVERYFMSIHLKPHGCGCHRNANTLTYFS